MQRIIKLVIDKVLALGALIILSPIMLIAAAGIKCTSKGPIFYKASRMGKNMKPMTIYKFRTMKIGADKQGAITGINDSRIYPWGNILRNTKVDELPQLINILNGSMSIVGPRPEDIEVVKKYYTEEEKNTLCVVPGLASPGSIFNYTHGDKFLADNDTDDMYVKNLLHIKLALDIYYLKHWTIFYDLEIIIRTIYAIFFSVFFNKQIPFPKEYIKVFGEKKL